MFTAVTGTFRDVFFCEERMSEQGLAMHYVCTREEARELTKPVARFWVSNCGCREGKGKCGRSRMDVCLMFAPGDPGSGSNKHEITRAEVEEIFQETEAKHLVARPFRNGARDATDGICFCCDDCCGYFLNKDEVCDKGRLIERTDMARCTECEVCADVCFFGARVMAGDRFQVLRENCYGCGVCLDVCPEACIEMVSRA